MLNVSKFTIINYDFILFAIEGMRNAMNSWDHTDSGTQYITKQDSPDLFELLNNKDDLITHSQYETVLRKHNIYDIYSMQKQEDTYVINTIGINDYKLMSRLSRAGRDHSKFLRSIPIGMRISAPLFWWKQFDTYKVGTVGLSTSTMHKIHSKEFTRDDFCTDNLSGYALETLDVTITCLNAYREEYNKSKNMANWRTMIELLPDSYIQTRNITLNYEVLKNIYNSRRNHKLTEWRRFCNYIEFLPLSELITSSIVSKASLLGVKTIDITSRNVSMDFIDALLHDNIFNETNSITNTVDPVLSNSIAYGSVNTIDDALKNIRQSIKPEIKIKVDPDVSIYDNSHFNTSSKQQ